MVCRCSALHFLIGFYKTYFIQKILPGLPANLSTIPHQLDILTLLEKLFSLIILVQVEITVKVNLTDSNLKMLQHVTPATHSIHPRLSSPYRTYTLQMYWCSTFIYISTLKTIIHIFLNVCIAQKLQH